MIFQQKYGEPLGRLALYCSFGFILSVWNHMIYSITRLILDWYDTYDIYIYLYYIYTFLFMYTNMHTNLLVIHIYIYIHISRHYTGKVRRTFPNLWIGGPSWEAVPPQLQRPFRIRWEALYCLGGCWLAEANGNRVAIEMLAMMFCFFDPANQKSWRLLH